VGLAFLGAALLLLAAGQTLLRGHLSGLGYILYWLACLACVLAAAITALVDAWLVRQELRRQQLELIRQTLETAAAKPDSKSGDTGR
jgi:hypothetical protein